MDHGIMLDRCIAYVRRAIREGMSPDQRFMSKRVNSGESHVGSVDIANTSLAHLYFSDLGMSLIVEEDGPKLADWAHDKWVIFVDPLDGSAEMGTGGAQFAAAVSVYNAEGQPVCGAAASPGIRPIIPSNYPGSDAEHGFTGFHDEMGALIFGSPDQVYLLPLNGIDLHQAIPVPVVPGRRLGDSIYSSISVDPNQSFICGFRKAIVGLEAGLAKVSFSNIFSQIQLILGQTDVVTIGPTPKQKKMRGSKIWDLVMPLNSGAGVRAFVIRDGVIAERGGIDRSWVNDGFVLQERLYLTRPEFAVGNISQVNLLMQTTEV